MIDHARIDRIAANIRAHLHAEALRAVADPEDPFTMEDLTQWRIEVHIEPAEIDPDDGEECAPEEVTATAYDLGHHSNVLFVRMATDNEVEEVG